MEWIFVTPVQAVVLTVPQLCHLNALARNGICRIAPLLFAAKASVVSPKTSDEALWTRLLLSLLLPAPVQLSLTAGVATANCWCVSEVTPIVTLSEPLPLLDAGAGLRTGRHMGSATMVVSLFILSVVVAVTIATFIEQEGDASSADDWRQLQTIPRVPLRVFFPLQTAAAGAVGAAAPFSVIMGKSCAAAGAILSL